MQYEDYLEDLSNKKNENLELSKIINKFKSLFEKLGYSIDWKELENQDSKKMINSFMASPFSIEEKQVLLETIDIKDREIKLDNIIDIILNILYVQLFNNQKYNPCQKHDLRIFKNLRF